MRGGFGSSRLLTRIAIEMFGKLKAPGYLLGMCHEYVS